jgi:hypothetical protein
MKVTCLQAALAVSALLTVSCGATSGDGGGGGTTGPTGPTGPTGTTAKGIALPREISALPTKGASAPAALRSASRALATFGPDTDYARAETFKFVDERALSQFEILNTIFKAISQTHYDDAAVLGKGPYLAMVSWTEERNGQQVKQLKKWQVDSKVVKVNGVDVNRVQVWFPFSINGSPVNLIRAQVDIVEAPRMNADGVSYADYGKWTLVAAYDPKAESFFAASADRDASGMATVKLHEFYPPAAAGQVATETRAILQKGSHSGAGRVLYPDLDCRGLAPGEPCGPRPTEVAYVYDGSTVTLKKGSEPAVSKDRTRVADLVNRYGLFDATTGAKVERNFGFPIRFPDAQGAEQLGYYGSIQGRHLVWTNDPNFQGFTPGTAVTRGDLPPDRSPQSYTPSPMYPGILVQRDLVPASIANLKGLYVDTGVSDNFQLLWDGSGWCRKPQEAPEGQSNEEAVSCAAADAVKMTEADFAREFVNDPGNWRHGVGIGYMRNAGQLGVETPVNLVYVPAGGAHPAGFYEAEPSPASPQVVMKIPPVRVDAEVPGQFLLMWVGIIDQVYVSWDGSRWVRKEVVALDPSTSTPTFGKNDAPFELDAGREYYFSTSGATYVVKRVDAGYDVRIEMPGVVNPRNAGAFVAAGTTFKPQGYDPRHPDWYSEYEFVTDEASPDFMKLLYVKVASDEPSSAAVGGPVILGRWGLLAYRGEQPTGTQFNWEYPLEGQLCGQQQFLKDGSGGLVILADPMRFTSVPLTSGAGETSGFQLQYDGLWVQGLPDVYQELRGANYDLTLDIANKVVTIPDGTEVTDRLDGKTYVFKQLQIDEYLYPTDAAPLDLSPANDLKLDTVPGYVPVDPPMVQMDPAAKLLYSEGNPVQ